MLERFTKEARRAVILAQEAAARRNDGHIDTEHILLGLIGESQGAAVETLQALGIDLESMRLQLEEAMGQAGQVPEENARFSSGALKALDLAEQETGRLGSGHITTGHILIGILREADGAAAQTLTTLGADLERVSQQLLRQIKESANSEEELSPGYLTFLEEDLVEVLIHELENDRISEDDMSSIASDFLDMADLAQDPEQIAEGLARLGKKYPLIEPVRERYIQRVPLLGMVLEVQAEKQEAIAGLEFDRAFHARNREKELLRKIRVLSPFHDE